MGYEIKVKTAEDAKNNIDISTAIVDTIFNNLQTNKKNIFAFSIIVEDENNQIYDVTVSRSEFSSILKENLIIQQNHEQYEMCGKIIETIKLLEENLEIGK